MNVKNMPLANIWNAGGSLTPTFSAESDKQSCECFYMKY